MLTGTELLTKVKELGDVSKTDLATQCGYVSKKKDGSDRVNFTAFYEALLGAKGIELGGGGAAVGRVGSCPTPPRCKATATFWSVRLIPQCST